MALQTTTLQVFVAWPSDVQVERDRLEQVVDGLNNGIAASRKLHLQLITWQTHTHPGMGKDAQDVINRQIKPTDIFIGIMWKRFGTPTKRAPSGTVEEFRSAYKLWKKNRRTHIMFYFNQKPIDVNVDLKQFGRVRAFRESLSKVGLISDYKGVADFEKKVRAHLEKVLLEWKTARGPSEPTGRTPTRSSMRKAVSPPPPQKPGLFVGRDEGLRELRKRLGTEDKKGAHRRPPTVTVFGSPGIGKTTLAAELTWDERIRKTFPDGTLWTTVGEAGERAALARWGVALGQDGEKVASAMTAEAAWNELANALKDRRMLLVVDDVWEPKQATRFQEILGPGCALVVTTRDRRLAMNLVDEPEKHAYQLPKLTDEAGLELLRVLAGPVVEMWRKRCLELVQAFEGLPLALQVAGRLLSEEYKKDPALAEKLLDDLPSGSRFFDASAPHKASHTVAALVKRSTDRLDKITRQRFATLGVSARPAIFSPDTLRDRWHVRDPQPTVDTLVNHGLLEPLGNGKYQMHAVLVSFANSLLHGSAKTMEAGKRK